MSRCIATVGDGHYTALVTRLNGLLDKVGDTAARHFTKGMKPHWPKHRDNPYAFKLYAIQEAVAMGHTTILWLDSAIVPIRSLDVLWDHIETHGHYLWRSGFNCAQSCNDACLAYFGLTRDQAEKMPEAASGVVGLDLTKLAPKALLEQWERAMLAGAFKGSREHNRAESSDPRFLFHRQDQSCLALAANMLNMESEEQGNYFAYFPQQINERTILTIKGR